MLNLFYAGSIKSMPPKLISDDRQNTVVPGYVPEADLAGFAIEQSLPIIPLTCVARSPICNVKLSRRRFRMNNAYGRIQSMLSAMGNVAPCN